jgi:hypothetical protein
MFGSPWFANPGGGDFYSHQIDQSVRFVEGTGDHLQRTPGSAGNRKTWTWSCWFKYTPRVYSSTGGDVVLFGADAGASNYIHLRIRQSSTPYNTFGVDGSGAIGSTKYTPLLRDPSGFYNFVFAFDTTQQTDTDRYKFYINGTRITDLSASSYPGQNTDWGVNNTIEHQIGQLTYAGSTEFEGCMSEVNFIDGTALDASSFGETKNGVWIPKDTSSLTFGTNGFLLKFEDSSDFGNDSSGQNNDYTAVSLSANRQSLDSPAFGGE